MTKFLDKLVEIFMCILVAQTGGNLFCIESAWDRKKKHNVNEIFLKPLLNSCWQEQIVKAFNFYKLND